MEPLKNRLYLPWVEGLGLGFVGVGVLFPFALGLLRQGIAFHPSDLSALFFKLLFRSAYVALAQSFLSAALVCVGAFLLALFFFKIEKTGGNWIRGLLRAYAVLGNFCFAMPSLLMVLVFVQLGQNLKFIPVQGLWAIVFSHVLLNLLFVSFALKRKMQSWWLAGGQEQCESAALFGMPKALICLNLWPRVFAAELVSWFFYVFFLCLGAFSTVLLLGASPRFSTPEVLLFYSLVNEPESSRVLLLILTQVFLVMLSLLAYRRAQEHWKREGADVGELLALPKVEGSWRVLHLPFYAATLILLGVFIYGLQILGPLPLKNWKDPDLLAAMSGTLFFAGSTGLATVFFFTLAFFGGKRFRRTGLLLWGLSSTLLMACWMGAGLNPGAWNTLNAKIFAAAFTLAFLRLPWLCQWIEEKFSAQPTEEIEAALLLGASEKSVLVDVLWKQSWHLLFRAVALSLLLSIGEIALITLFCPELPTLATLVQRKMQRYDFSFLPLLALVLLLFSASFYAVERVFCSATRRQRK